MSKILTVICQTINPPGTVKKIPNSVYRLISSGVEFYTNSYNELVRSYDNKYVLGPAGATELRVRKIDNNYYLNAEFWEYVGPF